MKGKYVIFDLDDTLIYEIEYLKSAYAEIARIISPQNYNDIYSKMLLSYDSRADVFGMLTKEFTGYSVDDFLYIYRNHLPTLQLNSGALEVIEYCKIKKYHLGLITDGRSVTQRNKLKALSLDNVFENVVISEEFGSAKPDIKNFQSFINSDILEYIYIADNTKKDFITPRALGWKTICLLDRGYNIHKQDLNLPAEFLPDNYIHDLHELLTMI
ncbi:hypothetical protein ASG01_12600 [Chryseobacterium sp. Leaf180]|uniref:HAD family hydrolase n=1 Tax=Chryseobacterium sp. Leaf180 TaxID=1736289 RepID=UPI0006FD36F3|nr:HAD-IA family hydrolase [Chryseobacterium sp. Leaf180]KQR91840.1 hypothetical protein ASG01_12600 [Chryseobacterium sp. Leaf180]